MRPPLSLWPQRLLLPLVCALTLITWLRQVTPPQAGRGQHTKRTAAFKVTEHSGIASLRCHLEKLCSWYRAVWPTMAHRLTLTVSICVLEIQQNFVSNSVSVFSLVTTLIFNPHCFMGLRPGKPSLLT